MKLIQNESEQQTIIIVEDDSGNATVLEMLLAMGTTYISFVYHSALELFKYLEEIKQNNPALFLIDYFLPDINGLALCRELHQIEDLKHVPTILVSASTDESLLKETQRMGVALLHKPYDIDTLFEAIRQETI